VRVKLYWMSVSHPSQAARKMLELKGVDFDVVNVLPLSQRAHLRLAGFPGGTVPALKLDGRRVQGSRQIARALDQLWPEPPLFPADPGTRARVEEAERWGDEVLQPVPRRIARYGAAHSLAVRRWGAAESPLPGRDAAARLSTPLVRYYLRTREADGRRGEEAVIRADLEALPSLLEHVDELLADGTLDPAQPNAATLQVLASVCLLHAISDLHELVDAHACAAPALELFPNYPGPLPPFLAADWLPRVAAG
jgi:glutathione S-transferase